MKTIVIHAATFCLALAAFGAQAGQVAPGDFGRNAVAAGTSTVAQRAPSISVDQRYIGINEGGLIENPAYRPVAGSAAETTVERAAAQREFYVGA